MVFDHTGGIVVVLVIGYPLAQVIVYSFLKYKLDGVTPASFVGLENYAFVLSDRTGGAQFGIR